MTYAARDPRLPFALTDLSMPLDRRARGYDVVLAGVALVLGLLGAVLVWAATREGSGESYLYRHLFNLGLAAMLMLTASRLDARLLRLFGPLVYGGSLLGLFAVLAIGTRVNGAKAWIRLGGGFELQPSEFMKLGLIVGLAVLFTRREDQDDDASPPTRDVLLALVLVAVPLALIMLQPDLGSAMVLGCAVFGVLVMAGVRPRWTVGLLVLGVLVAVIALKSGVVHGYQLDRIKSFTDPTVDPQGASYNVNQAHIAIAAGGLFGTGLFSGPQTNGGFVPEQQTDFIFSVAGEELGLIGAAAIIALFALLCWRGLAIAREADTAGRLVAVGVVCWFAFQAFQNIGMNLGLTPVTGVPLPFVSYGGSSMFAQGLAIGLLQAVRRRSLG
ncbi:MAG: rod shape determining protein RodA [Pseudonocardiales bacterium]|jgi:rod shape determining protein RodA|nr:rod shape determining protein RodA [Pseudonocardiales bacterium]